MSLKRPGMGRVEFNLGKVSADEVQATRILERRHFKDEEYAEEQRRRLGSKTSQDEEQVNLDDPNR